MNRRELLAAGIGIGSLAIANVSSARPGAADDKKQLLEGVIYCPMFPYMFCGSYTLYYAVQLDNGNCGSNPASLAGPNNMVCGCPGGDCQVTYYAEKMKPYASRVTGDHVINHKLKDQGMIAVPSTVGSVEGVVTVKSLLKVKDSSGGVLFHARVYDVTLIKSKLDKSELLGTISQDQFDKIPNRIDYFVGHQGKAIAGDVANDATVVSEEKKSMIVKDSTTTQTYLIVRKGD